MIDIQTYLPAKRKATSSGWVSFNAPCCVHNGETQDRRRRGGIKTNDNDWSYHCFNCGFTASFVLGRTLSFKARRLLSWLNVPQEEIERINLESLKHRSIEGILDDRQLEKTTTQRVQFKNKMLVESAQLIDDSDQDLIEYLQSRSIDYHEYPFMKDQQQKRPGILIPFTYNNQIVGQTIRFLDDRKPKYLNDLPTGYVFGMDWQSENWQQVIVVEGVFDALSISGVAVLHADVNDAQVQLIQSLGRDVVVVPDQDTAGMKLVDRAVELGWGVSMPDWPDDIKDVNDAVRTLGKLTTLLTIMQAKDTSRIKIELRKKQIVKRLRD